MWDKVINGVKKLTEVGITLISFGVVRAFQQQNLQHYLELQRHLRLFLLQKQMLENQFQ